MTAKMIVGLVAGVAALAVSIVVTVTAIRRDDSVAARQAKDAAQFEKGLAEQTKRLK
jgi:hypothetical protein